MTIIAKEKVFTQNHLLDLQRIQCQLFLDNCIYNNTDLTSNTKTRIKNIIEEKSTFYIPDLGLTEKLYLENVHLYIDLINLALEKNAIKFYLVDNEFTNFPYLMSYIDTPEKNIPFISSREIQFDANNNEHLKYLQNSFLIGVNPFTSFSCDEEYLQILSKMQFVKKRQYYNDKNLLSFKNFSSLFLTASNKNPNIDNATEIFRNLPFEHNEFFPNFLNKNMDTIKDNIYSTAKFDLVKNFDIKKHFTNFVINSYQNKFLQLPISGLISHNNFSHEKFNYYLLKKLFARYLDKLDMQETKNIFNSYKNNFFKKSLYSYHNTELVKSHLSKFFTNFNKELDDKFNHNDLFILHFILTMQTHLKNNGDGYIGEETYHKICKKYSQYEKEELLSFLSEIGFLKKDTNSILSSIIQHKFINENYVFSTIDEKNMYGFSMSRDEFSLPTKLNASTIKFILNNIEHSDFFYHIKGQKATFGVYSSAPLEFDKNVCATMILDTILEIKKATENEIRLKHPNQSFDGINYEYYIQTNTVNEIADRNIRQFILNSILSFNKESTQKLKVSSGKNKI